MMATYLSDNLYNLSLYRDHTLYSNRAQVQGHELFRLGRSSRSELNYYTPATAGEVWMAVACNRTRLADMLVVDRVNNLLGQRVILEGDDNAGFSTPDLVLDETIPTRVAYGARASVPGGATTEEGAWLRTFPPRAHRYWRLRVPTFGAKLQLGGLYLGESYRPEGQPRLPWNPEDRELAFQSTVSPALWVGSNRKAQRKVAQHHIVCRSTLDYDRLRLSILDRYQRGRVMWAIHDEDQAERSWLAFARAGVQTAPQPPGYRFPVVSVLLTEHQPLPR